MAAKKKTSIPGESAAARTRAMQAWMAHFRHPMKAEIAAVRSIIRQASDRVSERVKWDAPMFYFREDLATFDLTSRKYVELVLLGEQARELRAADGLAQVDPDGRRVMLFRNLAEVEKKRGALTMFVKEWVQAIEAGKRSAPQPDAS